MIGDRPAAREANFGPAGGDAYSNPDDRAEPPNRPKMDAFRAGRYAGDMRRFKWIDWNLQKIDAHGLSAEEVEAAFDRVYRLEQRRDESFRMFAETPSGRRIWVV